MPVTILPPFRASGSLFSGDKNGPSIILDTNVGSMPTDVDTFPDQSRSVIAYQDTPGGSGSLIVSSITGTAMSSGTPGVFTTGTVNSADPVVLDNSRVFVMWAEDEFIRARVANVSGTTITSFGTTVTLDTVTPPGDGEGPACALVDTDKIITTWTDQFGSSGNRLVSMIATISGDVITTNATTLWGSGSENWGGTDIVVLSTTSAIAVGGSSQGALRARAMSISGTSITVGSSFDIYSGGSNGATIARMSATQAVISYIDQNDTNKGKCAVLTASGLVLSLGTPEVFDAASLVVGVDKTGVDSISATQFIITWQDTSPSNLKSIVGTVSGSNITLDSDVLIDGGVSTAPHIRMLDATRAVVSSTNGVVNLHGQILVA